MPSIFVCMEGPMGGLIIVFVCESKFDANIWIEQRRKIESGVTFYVYERVQ